MDQAEEIGKSPSPITWNSSSDDKLRIRNLTVRDPAGQNLLHIPELAVNRGEAVWIDGPSGHWQINSSENAFRHMAPLRWAGRTPERKNTFHATKSLSSPRFIG